VLEGLVKDSMSLSNATRRELQDGIRTIAVQMGRRGLVQSDRDRQEGKRVVLLWQVTITVNVGGKHCVKQ
jgi:hypothetical protein